MSTKLTLVLSWRSFQRALHNRAFIIMILLCLASVLFSMLLGILTFTAHETIVKDVALAGISVTIALMMVFLSGEALVGEIEKGTINFMLSKPISRFSFLLGRFFGLVLTGVVSISLGAVMFLVMLYLTGGTPSLGLLPGFLYMIMEIAIIASLGVMFSSFSSSSLTATLLCALLYILGHLNPQLAILAGLFRSRGARFVVQIIRLLIPNLEYLNIRHEVVQGTTPGLTSTLITLGYVLLYVSGSIIIATMVFSRREL